MSFVEGWEGDGPNGAAFLGARIGLGATTALVLELPYFRVDADYRVYAGPAFHVGGSGLGNPYIGIELQPAGSDFFAELGGRIPVLTDEGDDFDALEPWHTDLSRFDAFTESIASVHAVGNVRHVTAAGLATRLRVGPILEIPRGETANRDLELYAVFAWHIGYETEKIRIGSGLSGRSLLTTRYPVGSSTRSQFEVHVDFGTWTVRPGVDFRVPIGSAANQVPAIFGVSLGASF
jgi:hypothetical protein